MKSAIVTFYFKNGLSLKINAISEPDFDVKKAGTAWMNVLLEKEVVNLIDESGSAYTIRLTEVLYIETSESPTES